MSKGKGQDGGKAGKGKALMDQMGLFGDTSAMDAMIYGDLEDDEELEKELLALQNEGSSKTASPARSAQVNKMLEMDRMITESLRDNPSDEEVSDTEDPELMAELQGLAEGRPVAPHEAPSAPAPVAPAQGDVSKILEDRLTNYQDAYTSAKAAGESSKARRLDRGLKTIRELMKKTKSGKTVDEVDIPPLVAVTTTKPAPSEDGPPPAKQPAPPVVKPKPDMTSNVSRPSALPDVILPTTYMAPRPAPFTAQSPVTPASPSEPSPVTEVPSNLSGEDADKYKLLNSRRNNYKNAAMQAKKSGDMALARKHMGTAKQFEKVVEALESGQPIDLTGMPPSPPGYSDAGSVSSLSLPLGGATVRAQSPEEDEPPPLTSEDKKKLFAAPEKAGSVKEALVQRMDKYKSSAEEAKAAGNGGKARRMARIVKQYEDAVKAHDYGRPLNFEELPCPPGFPPIPGGSRPDPSPVPSPAGTPTRTPAQAAPGPSSPQASGAGGGGGLPAPRQPPPKVSPQGVGRGRNSINRQMSTTSRAEQQAIFLQERQLQFKKAALIAKKNGDMELAKKYLKQGKGFDQMILASQSGLPVDLSQIPPPPGSKRSDESYEFVATSEEGAPAGDRDETYKRLEQEMITQIQMCNNNMDHFTRLGDVSSATKFEKMVANCRKDLNAVKNAYKHGDPVPRFHYETRQFSLVRCNPELGENTIELNIMRGINLCLPSGYSEKDMDTYVKYEFPYPNDDPQKGDSNTVKHTRSPEYESVVKIDVNRKSRSFLRLLKSNKTLKLEVFYKRGIFKSDKVLGTVNIKLAALENQCVFHESYDLMDGRKSIGGKLEVKLRVKDPFVTKQVEEVQEKWLVIDLIERKVPMPTRTAATAAVASRLPSSEPPGESFTSVKVLEYEKQLLQQQMHRYQGKLNQSEMDALGHKSQLLDKKIEKTKNFLKTSGVAGLRAYADSLEKAQRAYMEEAKVLVQRGNRDKAQVIMSKKKLAQNEIDAIRAKLG